jgi:hypothetical protein
MMFSKHVYDAVATQAKPTMQDDRIGASHSIGTVDLRYFVPKIQRIE